MAELAGGDEIARQDSVVPLFRRKASQQRWREDRNIPERPAIRPADRRLLGERVKLDPLRVRLIGDLVDEDLLCARHRPLRPLAIPELDCTGRGIDFSFDEHSANALLYC